MLRPLEAGSSGHVRCERRAQSVGLLFSVRADGEGALQAVLIGERRGEYFAAPLGELRQGPAGMFRLSVETDPRNVAGQPLEAYRLVAVVRAAAGNCALVLCGNLRGTFAVNWSLAREAACALYRQEEAAREPQRPAVYIEVRVVSPPEESRAEDAAVEGSSESAQEEETSTEPPGKVEPPIAEAEEAPIAEAEEAPITEAEEAPPTGAVLLGLDPGAAWPESLESVRALFFSSPAFDPFPAEDYVFIEAPLAAETGYANCAIGLKAREGKPISVCYALPGAFSTEPPAGLEGYVWRGLGAEGWWAVFLDAETGEELPAP